MINNFINNRCSEVRLMTDGERHTLSTALAELKYIKYYTFGKINLNNNPSRSYRRVIHITALINEAEYIAEILITGKKLQDIQPLGPDTKIYYNIKEI